MPLSARWLAIPWVALGLTGCGSPEPFAGEGSGRDGFCQGPFEAISAVQGRTTQSPLAERWVSVSGVISLPWPEPQDQGAFLQSESPDRDPDTSEGLFVRLRDLPAELGPGDRVAVRGRVTERDGMTQLTSVERLSRCGSASVERRRVLLEELERGEALEGQWLELEGPLHLARQDGWLSRGEIELGGPARHPAQGHAAGAEAGAAALLAVAGGRELARWREAGRDAPRLWLGDAARAASGALVERAGRYVLRLGQLPSFETPPEPAPPPRADASSLRIAGLNLKNYFATSDGGAASQAERERQETKLAAVLEALNADVIALGEVENSGSGLNGRLLPRLNAGRSDADRYVEALAAPASRGRVRCAIAYRPGRLTPAAPASYDADPRHRRPALVARFQAQDASLIVIAVHMTSRWCRGAATRSRCGAEERRAEALALAELVARLESEEPRADIAVAGDFNADSLEEPLQLLRGAGLRDLLDAVPLAQRYSYAFEGQVSLLDHVLANAPLAGKLARAGIWHVNADAPRWLDYRQDNPANLFRDDAVRSSDHDPVYVDVSYP